MKYTDELINSVNKFNENIEEIAQKILNLKLELNEKDIDAKTLFDMKYKLSVINNVKSRKLTEKLLEKRNYREMKRGCELIESWETEEMTLDCTYIEQDKLNEQGYYTVIHCTDAKQDLYKISVFQRNK